MYVSYRFMLDETQYRITNLSPKRDFTFMAKGKAGQQVVGAGGISLKISLQLSNRVI